MATKPQVIFEAGKDFPESGSEPVETAKRSEAEKQPKPPTHQPAEKAGQTVAEEKGHSGDGQEAARGKTDAAEPKPPSPDKSDSKGNNPTGVEGKFFGQHEDERVLYEVRPHAWGTRLSIMKLGAVAGALFLLFVVMGTGFDFVPGWLTILGIVASAGIFLGGAYIIKKTDDKNVAYITDRRIVRFAASTPFAVSPRTLSWDEAVKVKTFSPNFLLRTMNVGTVVIHAKSTVALGEMSQPVSVSDDDVSLHEVHYYKDLGNYIDKVIYLYKKKPEELVSLKQFVPKPRGQRD